MTSSYVRLVVSVFALVGLSGFPVCAQTVQDEQGTTAPQPGAAGGDQVYPLASKEEMVRDRFQRFEDRVYRLRELLNEQEPDNVARLARVLQRAGELGLAERLNELVELLRDPALLNEAADAEMKWVADADRLLAVLLEGDSDNEERKNEIQRLQDYHQKTGELLDQERALRSETSQAAMTSRMKAQLDQAIKRLNELYRRQTKVSEQTREQRDASGEDTKRLADRQADMSRDAKRLAEDLERLAELQPEESGDSPSLSAARSETESASESVQKGADAMSEAGGKLQRSDTKSAQDQQKEALEALDEARERLERARQELDEQSETDAQAEQQQQLADQTGSLSDQMQKDAESEGAQGQQGGQSQSPGQQNIEQAQREMEDASQSLGQSKPQDALPKQDQAIDQLQQAQEELEQALSQLRQEEREEILRDLEGRFREMLFKQQAINAATIRLNKVGATNFGRAERLELADQSVQERSLSDDAATCLHILDEDGTTVVFPRVVGQISEDMTAVADRLAVAKVGALTQTIEGEIVEALEELLQAVQRMRQESEQSAGMKMSSEEDDLQPLLPTSAELKLLRSGQVRVNERTSAIETAQGDASESADALNDALRAVAMRQIDCSEMAKEMRDRQKRR